MADLTSVYVGINKPTPWDAELTKLEADARAALFQPADEYGWETLKAPEGIQSWYKNVEECPAPVLKSCATLPATVEQTRRILADMANRSLWKPKFSDYRSIAVFDANTEQFTYAFQPPMASKRDFNIIFRTIPIPAHGSPEGSPINSYLMIAKSIVTPDTCPEISGVVRGSVLIWAYYLTPNATNPDQCDLTYCSGNNPMGSIPKLLLSGFKGSVTDMINSMKTELFIKQKDIVDKIYQEYGKVMEQRLKDMQ